MADSSLNIKKISLADGEHYIDAKYLLDKDGNEKSYENIVALISDAGFEVQVSPAASVADFLASVPANPENYAAYKQKIVLVTDNDKLSGSYVEFVITRTGASGSYVYAWERIGSTKTDLSGYQQTGKTLTTSVPSTNATGSAGEQTASGTATITYKKATEAASAGGHSHTVNLGKSEQKVLTGITDVSNVGDHAHGATFSGTTATITISASGKNCPAGSVTVDNAGAHTHTVNVATTKTGIVSGVDAEQVGDHAHTIELSGTKQKFISALDANTGSAGAHTHSITPTTATISYATGAASATFSALKSVTVSAPTASAFNSATVSNAGILSFGAGTFVTSATVSSTTSDTAIKTLSTDTLTYVSGVSATGSAGGHSHTMGGTAATLNYVAPATFTSNAAGGHDHTITLTHATITYVTSATTSEAGGHTHTASFAGTTATYSVSGSTTYKPAGSVSMDAAGGHTHTVSASSVTLSYVSSATLSSNGAHTHSVSTTDATVSGNVSVAVANHTHSLNNHTHSVTTAN